MRWVSDSLNCSNRSSHLGVQYDFTDELPNDFKPFTKYVMRNGKIRQFENLFMKIENNEPKFITSNSEHQFRYLHADKVSSPSSSTPAKQATKPR
jgi:hypothetical protein